MREWGERKKEGYEIYIWRLREIMGKEREGEKEDLSKKGEEGEKDSEKMGDEGIGERKTDGIKKGEVREKDSEKMGERRKSDTCGEKGSENG